MLLLFQLGLLNDNLFGKELFIRLTVCVLVNVYQSVFVLLSLLVLRVGCGI